MKENISAGSSVVKVVIGATTIPKSPLDDLLLLPIITKMTTTGIAVRVRVVIATITRVVRVVIVVADQGQVLVVNEVVMIPMIVMIIIQNQVNQSMVVTVMIHVIVIPTIVKTLVGKVDPKRLLRYLIKMSTKRVERMNHVRHIPNVTI
jgi:hypothetical protein